MKLKGIVKTLIAIGFTASISCNNQKSEQKDTNTQSDNDSTVAIKTDNLTDTTYIADSEYATYYLVIADTGRVYHVLQQKMFKIHKELGQAIDTMDRYYNTEKDLISCPDTLKDEIYAGEYFPRRDLSNTLSIEYLDFYNNGEGAKSMILLSGIYETEASADSALAILKKTEPKSFKMKSEVFQGCMH